MAGKVPKLRGEPIVLFTIRKGPGGWTALKVNAYDAGDNAVTVESVDRIEPGTFQEAKDKFKIWFSLYSNALRMIGRTEHQPACMQDLSKLKPEPIERIGEDVQG